MLADGGANGVDFQEDGFDRAAELDGFEGRLEGPEKDAGVGAGLGEADGARDLGGVGAAERECERGGGEGGVGQVAGEPVDETAEEEQDGLEGFELVFRIVIRAEMLRGRDEVERAARVLQETAAEVHAVAR